jgi:hypothetical protein
MPNDLPQLRTPGVIAAEVGAPLNRVLYILRTHAIRPIGRAGTLRLYDNDALARVRYELNVIAARRSDREGVRHAE